MLHALAMHSSVSTSSTDEVREAAENSAREESEQGVTDQSQKKNLRGSFASLLSESFLPSQNNESHKHTNSQSIWSDHYFASDLNEPTLRESPAQAGRQDMVAGVDHESTITNKLRSMLHSAQDQAAATNSDDENQPKPLLSAIPGNKTATV